MVSAKIVLLVMSYNMTEIPTNTSVPAKNTTFIGRQMAFVTVNFNKAHVQKAIDWFWMKSAGSRHVLAPSFPQNIPTENAIRNTHRVLVQMGS